MAHRLKAISLMGPRLKHSTSIKINEISEFIEGRTGIQRSSIKSALDELQATIIFFNKLGKAVVLPGLGTFTPHITLEGVVNTKFRQNKELSAKLGTDEQYLEDIINRDNIGKTPDELVTLWNEENPTDPVTP